MLPFILLAGRTGPGPPPEAVTLKKSCDKNAAAALLQARGLHERGEGGPPATPRSRPGS